MEIRPIADWLAARESSAWVTGPGLQRWEERLPVGTLVMEAARREPTPEALLRLGLARYRAGLRDDLWALEPLYLRPSSAEEQWRDLAAARGGSHVLNAHSGNRPSRNSGSGGCSTGR